jgi:hypothetical protein
MYYGDKEITFKLKELEQQKQELQAIFAKRKQDYFSNLKVQGWQEFIFESEYDESHSPYGSSAGSNEKRKYLFHPSVKIPEFSMFRHHYYGKNDAYEEFELFLEKFDDKYYEF